jgi:hypothetical protein
MTRNGRAGSERVWLGDYDQPFPVPSISNLQELAHYDGCEKKKRLAGVTVRNFESATCDSSWILTRKWGENATPSRRR